MEERRVQWTVATRRTQAEDEPTHSGEINISDFCQSQISTALTFMYSHCLEETFLRPETLLMVVGRTCR